MDRYAVLVFRDQRVNDEEQLAFTKHFGELENYRTPGHIRRREESGSARYGGTFETRPGTCDDHAGADDRVVVLQAGRPAVAFRQPVPSGAGEVFGCCPGGCRPGAPTPEFADMLRRL